MNYSTIQKPLKGLVLLDPTPKEEEPFLPSLTLFFGARAFVHISHVVATPTLRGDGAHRTWRSGTGDGGQVVLRNDSSGQLEETLFWGEKGGSSSGGLHRGHVAKKRRIRMNLWVIYSIG